MLEKATHKEAPKPISTRESRSYLVKTSPSILAERRLLKTRVREEVELRVIMSAYERLPTQISLELDFVIYQQGLGLQI
jgi:hypothetical protein